MTLALVQADDPSNIGYEYIGTDNHLHTFNQNPLGLNASNIWFNGTSDYLQFFNGEDRQEALERSSWVEMNFGLGYYKNNGTFEYIVQDHLNGAISNVSSDFETYWQQLLYKCLELGGREICAGWKRGQNTYDRFMKNHFYLYANEPITFNKNVSSLWVMKNIDIMNDGLQNDIVYYCYDDLVPSLDNETNITYWYSQNHCDSIKTNNPNSIIVYNLTSFKVEDTLTKEGHVVLWNQSTDVRLRYKNGNLALESPLTEPLIDWRGIQSTKMWWIDAGPECEDGVFEDSSLPAGYGRSIICPDTTNFMTGYIHLQGAVGPYTAYKNVDPKHGERHISRPDQYQRQAYWGFNTNLSEIPKNALIEDVSFRNVLTDTQVVATVGNWKTSFYDCGSDYDCISDFGGLNKSAGDNDWFLGQMNYTGLQVDWDSDLGCDSNFPCNSSILIGNRTVDTSVKNLSAYIGFSASLQNDAWYSLMLIDSSTWSSGDNWFVTLDALQDPVNNWVRSHLNITFFMPDGGLNVNISIPHNNTVYNDSSLNLNVSGYANGSYYIKETIVNVNGTLYTNTTQVSNGSVGYGGIPISGVGSYWVEINVTDEFNYENMSGRFNFTLELKEEDEIEVLQEIKKRSVFPLVLFLSMMFVAISQRRLNGKKEQVANED